MFLPSFPIPDDELFGFERYDDSSGKSASC